MTENLRQAVSAVQSTINRATVFLARLGEAHGRINTGSGVLLQTHGERIVVVTARHVIEDMRHRELYVGYYQSHLPIGGMQPSYRLHPTADVGVLIIPRPHEKRLSPFALRTSVVAESRQGIVALWLVGFPDVTSRIRTTDRNEYGFLEHGCALHVEDVRSHDERIVVAWTNTKLEGDLHELSNARGMIGGALWGLIERRKPVADVRNAKRNLRLVGIQSAQDDPSGERLATIEPVERWSSWLQDTIEAVEADPAIP